jgi:hypothetical protein
VFTLWSGVFFLVLLGSCGGLPFFSCSFLISAGWQLRMAVTMLLALWVFLAVAASSDPVFVDFVPVVPELDSRTSPDEPRLMHMAATDNEGASWTLGYQASRRPEVMHVDNLRGLQTVKCGNHDLEMEFYTAEGVVLLSFLSSLVLLLFFFCCSCPCFWDIRASRKYCHWRSQVAM